MPFRPLNQNSFRELEQTSETTSNFKSKSLPIPGGNIDTITGFTKGAVSTLQNIGMPIAKGVDFLTSKLTGRPRQELGFSQEQLAPTNKTQEFAKKGEQIAEYFIPAGGLTKAELAINTMTKGLPKLVGAGTRILGKSLVQGVGAGTVNLAQKGDLKEARNTALTAGIIRGSFATIGEGARALKLPERLYSVIFKNSKSDMMSELKEGGIKNLQVNKPDLYKQYLDAGLIKIKNGQPIVNDTLAEQALDKGLKGSIKTMANHVIEKSLESEAKLQNIARTSTATVDVSEKQFASVLKNIADDYQDVGFGEIAEQAGNLAKKIELTGGKLNIEDGIALRRFLDRMRIATSFDKPVTKLSLTQGNFKTLADALRGRLSKIEGIGEIMKDYSYYIDALEAISADATRRGNSQVISMIDSLFLGGGVASNEPVSAATLIGIRRLLSSPTGTTYLGQLLNKANASQLTSGVTGATSGTISSVLNQSTPK